VGPSGAGKSTLVAALLRFVEPEAGVLELDGVDVRWLPTEDVRARIAWCGQDAHVFHTTIRENVRLARPDASDDELLDVLRAVRLDVRIAALPRGLDTVLGEDGVGLSGGERQRLVLARALLAPAEILLLDEPTAHLDGPLAEQLMDDVLDAASGRALLVVTHRPYALERFDEVLAVDAGTVAVRTPQYDHVR
jgi:ABC-type multidrug transport system fused ATPase/permease subunit